MFERMDKSKIFLLTHEEAEIMDDNHWAKADVKDRIRMLILLREYAYGKNANNDKMEKKIRIINRNNKE